jgi:beta-1,4-mannosyl-glycoprotein beta-1,4-N-acetylglucosaminyltransferase
MLYNCVPFYNELDLLEVRLHTMNKYVDKFIICEMNTTHSSKDKPFHLEESKERFKDFHSKTFILKSIVQALKTLGQMKIIKEI